MDWTSSTERAEELVAKTNAEVVEIEQSSLTEEDIELDKFEGKEAIQALVVR